MDGTPHTHDEKPHDLDPHPTETPDTQPHDTEVPDGEAPSGGALSGAARDGEVLGSEALSGEALDTEVPGGEVRSGEAASGEVRDSDVSGGEVRGWEVLGGEVAGGAAARGGGVRGGEGVGGAARGGEVRWGEGGLEGGKASVEAGAVGGGAGTGAGAKGKADGRVVRGEQTRRVILERAMEIASCEGLEGLSIGRLAADLSLSKSGVFAHFGSKEELQLATVRAARRVFTERVVLRAQARPDGLPRAEALLSQWLGYVSDGVFPGGCIIYSIAAEFDSRPGRVRDAIARDMADWRTYLTETLRTAVAQGELSAHIDPAQLAFELSAYVWQAVGDSALQNSPAPLNQAARAIATRLFHATHP
ncbi:TetR/AcrR family transcriptional regulator [Actinocorallia sp. A-T 12471]|uniref:TetR/AcrR family transcriptional regulator n=1 Tax=Actinocorallia sp. A-T 12471 TaxID=3089813 RepID=UPI0029D0394F|nr:TetR/AcrR family transcriptional regulator [Actinocorallia sp. A-T 12471]MDX6744845.1 TetR/AcrR family transcriptional regulator [Actinocorallia sp. A-T 12471]